MNPGNDRNGNHNMMHSQSEQFDENGNYIPPPDERVYRTGNVSSNNLCTIDRLIDD
jgi:hypothetical protein